MTKEWQEAFITAAYTLFDLGMQYGLAVCEENHLTLELRAQSEVWTSPRFIEAMNLWVAAHQKPVGPIAGKRLPSKTKHKKKR